MAIDEQAIAEFQTRVRQLIAQCQRLRRENEELWAALNAADSESQQQRDDAAKAKAELEAMRTARMLTLADGDIEAAKKRIDALVRDVNRCMAILAEQD